jgi:hypothetical protein
MAGRSRMNREVHVRFCEGLGVKFPRATRLGNLRLTDSSDILSGFMSKSRLIAETNGLGNMF